MEAYAIIDIGGSQYKISTDDLVRVPRLPSEVGQSIELERVLLYSDGKKVEVGTPFLEGKKVQAEVVRHGKEKKVIVFKKKRRKNYRRKRGHRQPFTEIQIKALSG
jgi:large subunit ribosomal protein L21